MSYLERVAEVVLRYIYEMKEMYGVTAVSLDMLKSRFYNHSARLEQACGFLMRESLLQTFDDKGKTTYKITEKGIKRSREKEKDILS